MKRLIDFVQHTRERQRTRKQLLNLPVEQLRDLAISPQDAQREGRKHFWE
ncbi:DUF1127 domain-containing protein [Leucothrix mucor]|nr:DUF1127 domain-containing protein [Leucothrix mucor]